MKQYYDEFLDIEEVVLGMARIVYEKRDLEKENRQLKQELAEKQKALDSIHKSCMERDMNLLNFLCNTESEIKER